MKAKSRPCPVAHPQPALLWSVLHQCWQPASKWSWPGLQPCSSVLAPFPGSTHTSQTLARVWPHVLPPIPEMKKRKSESERKPGSRGLGGPLTKVRRPTCIPFCASSLHPHLSPSLPRLPDGSGEHWLATCGTRRWRQRRYLILQLSPRPPALLPGKWSL